MGRLLFMIFKNEAASNMSNEVFNIVCKDENLIVEWRRNQNTTGIRHRLWTLRNKCNRYNIEIQLIMLKGLTNLFPEVSVFSDTKHSNAGS